MSPGITFDTGALIALERRSQRMTEFFENARLRRRLITIPSAVVAEWWRGRTDVRDKLLSFLFIEPLSEMIAKGAGEAIAKVKGATIVDAIVMASAASRGDIVYTSDFDDLERLRTHFPGVRIFAV